MAEDFFFGCGGLASDRGQIHEGASKAIPREEEVELDL
jgi:hypothetical protein